MPARTAGRMAAVVAVRMLTLLIGGIQYPAFAFLHTAANQAAGLVAWAFPLWLYSGGVTAAMIVIGLTASVPALEELLMTRRADTLNRNTRGLWELQRRRIRKKK